MKKNIIHRIWAILLLTVIAAALAPYGLFHDHSHEEICEINSNLPQQFKTEKDSAKEHFHAFAEKCFSCKAYILTSFNYTNYKSSEIKFQSGDTNFRLYSEDIITFPHIPSKRGPPTFV